MLTRTHRRTGPRTYRGPAQAAHTVSNGTGTAADKTAMLNRLADQWAVSCKSASAATDKTIAEDRS
jgi:hypothetical protein